MVNKKGKRTWTKNMLCEGEIMKDKNVNIEAVKVYDDLREKLSKAGFAAGHCELHINRTSGYVMHIEFDITPDQFGAKKEATAKVEHELKHLIQLTENDNEAQHGFKYIRPFRENALDYDQDKIKAQQQADAEKDALQSTN